MSADNRPLIETLFSDLAPKTNKKGKKKKRKINIIWRVKRGDIIIFRSSTVGVWIPNMQWFFPSPTVWWVDWSHIAAVQYRASEPTRTHCQLLMRLSSYSKIVLTNSSFIMIMLATFWNGNRICSSTSISATHTSIPINKIKSLYLLWNRICATCHGKKSFICPSEKQLMMEHTKSPHLLQNEICPSNSSNQWWKIQSHQQTKGTAPVIEQKLGSN